MGAGNSTVIREFIMLGLSGFGSLWGPLFWGVLCIYLLTLLGNSLTILLTLADPALHSPVYFFLRHFSLVESLCPTTLVPRMLADLLASCPTISAACHFTPLYFSALSGIAECCLLTARACVHYTASVGRLPYTTLMNQGGVHASMVGASYLMGLFTGTTHSIFIFTLPFRGANTIHHFLCDILPVLGLASASTFWGEVGNLAVMVAFTPTPFFLLIIASYACILATILGVATSQGRQKVFSTCSSLLFVVMLFFGTGTVAYMRPWAGSSQDTGQILAFFSAVVAPVFNPFVYTLRDKEVTGAMRRLVKRYVWSP
ncbi:LOW QUALITY PROTEIN: olfactory receptor 9-like [Eumetopias jubatus]|uniref:LOW QUALITY PROTEIN: olfactory receptor 9-like n=1 Tax=Eumetopias jubatus TaxID=34886 RepID=UPI001016016B|nr:LOW QUALITY PROTEIN: olfactory receptor 9-like [Eumetopias jubatus]